MIMEVVRELESFLRNLDPGLGKYKDQFIKYDVRSMNTLKYLRPQEVDDMDLPEVYKRMLVDKIVNLQTPDTKSKMKSEVQQTRRPKRLRFEQSSDLNSNNIGENDRMQSTTLHSTSSPSAPTENESESFLHKEMTRLKDEKETLVILLSNKNDDLKDLRRKPVEREIMGIPGNPVTKFVCDNCHYKGHRATGNKGNKKCPYMPCEGFHICGVESKHLDHKQAITETVKEIASYEKRMKTIEDEITSIKTFIHHNSTNFITVMRPVLKGLFPHRYAGQNGTQLLHKEIRLLKIACGGKIPSDKSKQNITMLIEHGRSNVSSVCGKWEDDRTIGSSNLNTSTIVHVTSSQARKESPSSTYSNTSSSSNSLSLGSDSLNFSNTYQYLPNTTSPPTSGSSSSQFLNHQYWNPCLQPYGYYWNTYVPVCTSPPSTCSSDQSAVSPNPPLPAENPPMNPPLPDDPYI